MIYSMVMSTIPPDVDAEKGEDNQKTGKMNNGSGDPKFEKSLISGIISLILLTIIKRSKEPLYGYLIWKQMEARENGNVSLKQGTIYPVLRMLQKEGLLESEIRASDAGPARKYYWITAKGEKTLKIWEESWCRTKDFVENILGGETDE